jgi:NitT/TauT family transport system substrate-binding protein
MTRTLRMLSWMVATSMLVALAAACGNDAAPSPTSPAAVSTPATTTELTDVTVGFVPVLIFGPVMLAKEKGYFEEYGLNVRLEPLAGGSDMVVLTANRNYDIGIGGAGPAYFNAVQRGIELHIIGPMHFERAPQATPLMVKRERFESGELTSAADLRGKRVSVNARGATEYWLDTALRTNGLTIADVDLQTLPFPDVPAALESGALDAAMLGEPLATQAERNGIAVRLEVDFPADFQPTFVWANPDFARESPELAIGFMAGMLRGCRDLWGEDWDSEENLSILNQYTNVPPDLIREAARTWCEPNGEINAGDLDTLQRFFAERGLLEYDEMLPVDSLIDSTFVEAARERVGTVDYE